VKTAPSPVVKAAPAPVDKAVPTQVVKVVQAPVVNQTQPVKVAAAVVQSAPAVKATPAPVKNETVSSKAQTKQKTAAYVDGDILEYANKLEEPTAAPKPKNV